MTEIDLDNKEWQDALQIIQYTRRSLFLTGKAGTGKSTFLRYIAKNTKKKHVILAPTGISAINVGGSTLHSFFRLPFHPLLPNDSRYSIRNIRKTLKYNSAHSKLLQEIELIIIDEISMVRADIIDFIDKVLRIYCRNMREPFGGKQLLLIGDIYQLEPVLKEEDWRLLQPYYASAYFFSATVFQQMQLVSIELHKVYRQTDNTFIGILDRIRNSSAQSDDLKALNARVGSQLNMHNSQLAVTLASRRDTVDYINEQQLNKLDGQSSIFRGKIRGDFPESSLPTPIELEVKPGAQVIFIKNDKDKRWVNGTLGVVDCIDEEAGIISVINEEGVEYDVEREIWENVRYTYNEKEQKIEEEQLGVYQQFPLRLAWAITIHKSQGLTFKQVNIDLSGGVFAGGQTYVALSRCTSLEGITLQEPIKQSDIFVRAEVLNFARHYNNQQLIDRAINESKADREYKDAISAFDNQEFDTFIENFFKAIHSRYDIEKPVAKRYIRRKLNIINEQQTQIKLLSEEIKKKETFLKRLAAEYTLLGKECEHEHMYDAAIKNYEKALELYSDAGDALRRLKKLQKKKNS
jgi:ATP-dependent exoDNAse (exonuclease V) alpha subunit